MGTRQNPAESLHVPVDPTRVAIAFGQEQVLVRVDAATKVEIGTSEEAQIILGKNAELEDGNGDGLQRSRETRFRTILKID